MVKKNNFFIYSCLLILGYVILFLPNIYITYGTSEDVIMREIAEGTVTGNPDGHLILIKYCLGIIIAELYTLTDQLNCYGCLMLIIITSCVLLTIWRLKNKCKNVPFNLISVLFVFVCVFWANIVNLQYTFVSAIVMATSFLYYNTMDSIKIKFRKEVVLISLGIILSYCICSKVFFLALPFWGLCIMCQKVHYKENIMMIFLACIGILAVEGIEAYAYSSIEWKNYKEFYKCYEMLYGQYGVPSWNENMDFYKTIGMKEHDVVNLERQNLYLVDGLLEGRMRDITEYAVQQWKIHNSELDMLKRLVKRVLEIYTMSNIFLLNALSKSILLLTVYYGRKDKEVLLFELIIIVIEVILFMCFGWKEKLNIHMIVSTLLIEIMLGIAILIRMFQFDRINILNDYLMGLIAVFMLCSIVYMGTTIQTVQEERYVKNGEYIALQAYYRDNEESIYFTNIAYIEDYTDNFKLQEKRHKKNGILLGGWTTFSPIEKEGLKQYGVNKVDKAFVEMDKVYLVYQNPSSRISAHYNENYGDIQWSEVDHAPMRGASMPVYKVYLAD